MIIEDDMIVKMKIPSIIQPRMGEINATPSGLDSYFIANFYNPYTPLGLGNLSLIHFYNPYTPLGLGNRSMLPFYNINTPLGLKQ